MMTLFISQYGLKKLNNIKNLVNLITRCLSAKQTAKALRPFYFSVHPDFFGKYPQEQAVNQESLKILHEYITCQQKVIKTKPAQVTFYIRSQYTNSKELKRVDFNLIGKSVRNTVITVLERCDLPLSYINTIPKDSSQGDSNEFSRPIKWHPSFYAATGKKPPFGEAFTQPIIEVTLRSWLRKNIDNIRTLEESTTAVQDDINKLRCQLIDHLELNDIRWESFWGFSHFRGCLKGFHQLYKEHPLQVKETLKGRTLVFGNNSGVSLHGDVVLSGEDVRADWIKILRSVSAYDAVLERLPYMEKKLSELLNNIQVVRRKHYHHITMADEYEVLLNKLLNTLRRSQVLSEKWLGDESLSDVQIVVEGESGPLALSNTGQFLLPASVPGSLIVEFIAKNKEQGSYTLKQNMSYRLYEEKAIEECKQHLELKEISKDENITCEQMITCCERLVTEYWKLGILLTDTRLNISHYYSMMQDGKICIPWNCKMDE
ncbi:hypothetical protein SNE40_007108 [Patella caerulea]|uniref:T-cell activation inhibitor, mitochondrial n=2 Tax=Patella caerulea TaxID=87958 RepID=A0AAN8JXU9_PATCE